jgi:hypothetical protein
MEQELINKIRQLLPSKIAADICSVQKMPDDFFIDLLASGHSEEWLIANDYMPIDDQTKLMWVKKNGDL